MKFTVRLLALTGILFLGATAHAKTACFKTDDAIGRISVDSKLIVVLYDLKITADYAKESGWTQSFARKEDGTIVAQAYLEGVGDGATTVVVLSPSRVTFKDTKGQVNADYPVVPCP